MSPVVIKENITLTIDPSAAGDRLDVFLSRTLPQYSRNRLQRLIKKNYITVNGDSAKPKHEIQAGEIVDVQIPEILEQVPYPEDIELDILYEDDTIIVLNKQPGLLVHSTPGQNSHTLVNALLGYRGSMPDVGDPRRPGIVHRLDKDTSGVMVVAKTAMAFDALKAQFKKRSLKKEYIAIVRGCPGWNEAYIDAPIGRSKTSPVKMSIRLDRGKKSFTRVEVLERFRENAVIRARPETGRTHQIRVHLSSRGYPLLCDYIYGGGKRFPSKKQHGAENALLKRHALHARSLELTVPGRDERMTFHAELPEDMRSTMEFLHAQGKETSVGQADDI